MSPPYSGYMEATLTKPGFLGLPTETLIDILLQLDITDLLACQQVCRRIRAIVKLSSEIQYKICLAISGAIDGARRGLGGPAVADRMAGLQAHKRAWQLHSELVLGTAYSSPDAATAQHLPKIFPFNGTLIALQIGPELRLSHPQSHTRSVPTNEWLLNLNKFGIIEANSGASQLSRGVVAITGRNDVHSGFCIHMFLLRPDGRVVPHPLALSSVIEVPGVVNAWSASYSVVGVCGDVVLCCVGGSVYVYNWKTGMIVLTLDEGRMMFTQLVDERLLLRGQDTTIYAYAIDPDLESGTGQVDTPPICTLRLPCHPSHQFDSFAWSLDCDIPHPDPTEYRGSFQDDPSFTLVAITFVFHTDSISHARHILCIPRSTLLAHIQAARDGARELAWEEWALDDGIVLRHDAGLSATTKMRFCTSGPRLMVAMIPAFPQEPAPPPPPTLIDVFVFHTHPWAAPPSMRAEKERIASYAARYFTILPASALARNAALMPASPPRELSYAIYHKAIHIAPEHGAAMPETPGLMFFAAICEDGMSVMGCVQSLPIAAGSGFKVTYTWTFST